jgi:flagellar hook-associated protein 1
MSGLIGSLINNTKSLSASSAAIEIAGKNLANVNNPAYARQSVVIGDRGTVLTAYGPQSMGVEASGIQSARDSIIDSQIMRELMNSGSLEAKQKILTLLESAIGEGLDSQAAAAQATGSDNSSTKAGLSLAIDNLFAAFSALSADPTSQAQRQAVMQSATQLTDYFHSLNSRLNELDSTVVSQITTDAASAQTLLGDIASLNDEIAKIELRSPGGALDLRDKRQGKLEELAQYMDFRVENTGELGGIRVIGRDSTSADLVLVDGATVNGTISYTGAGFTAGNPATALQLSGGSLSALQGLRTGEIADYASGLDDLAEQFVVSVNAAYGAQFFRVDGTDATLYKSASDIQLNPTLTASGIVTGASGQPGDNSRVAAIADLANHVFVSTDSIQGTFSGFYASKVTDVGTAVSSAGQQLENSSLVSEMLTRQRESVSGVSTDEEMSDLLRFQRAFQGTARVINIMDEMLNLIVNGLSR